MTTRSPRRSSDSRLQLAQKMQGEYYAGMSIRGLAAEYEVAYGTVRNYLLLVRTQLRPRGGGLPRTAGQGWRTGGGA
ncbi:helix-turn-helix domain-containing protein [Streptomyces sp. AMCC400023]|uniref:helix-turn-helix domain-containing protein n=1 Tax=Streptomyces sp. AMCC400023 TaxID=2056258 RepID=UPI001F1E9D20|nr:transcriptional regulator [Streptomyces sp. AMCC400023]UJV42920.1 transcriptional regulator [Streptomyces sp. AMCC400023]